jgi:hypothetical protein
LAVSVCGLAYGVVRERTLSIVLFGVLTLFQLALLSTAMRRRVTVETGSIEVTEQGVRRTFEPGHAVWVRAADRPNGSPTVIFLVDEWGARRQIPLGQFPPEGARAILDAVTRMFPEAPKGTKQALPEHFQARPPEQLPPSPYGPGGSW